MKISMAMAAAKFVAAIVLPALFQVGQTAVAQPRPSQAGQSTPVVKRLRPGQQHKVLAAHGKSTSRRQSLRDNVPEQLETWHDSGSAVESTLATADILKLSAGITAETFLAQLHAIVDPDPTRFIAFNGNKVAAANVKAAFEKLGLQTELQPLGVNDALSQYGLSPAKQREMSGNVIGYLRGTDRADEVVIVACHYDSVNWEDISGPAPGVDDNGSGVALMLSLAQVLSQSAVKPRRSVLFVSFQAEEVGLVGSKKFSELFMSGGSGLTRFGRPVAAIVADEVAWPGKSTDLRKVIFETKGRGQGTNTVVDTLAHASQQQCSGGFGDCVNGFVVNYHGFGSDHIPMLDVGIPAVLLIERDNMYHADTWGHTAKDTFQHIDPAFGAATTRLAFQAVAALANPKA
jgi:hypothetical protein